VGVLGGSFNPAHAGHRHVAEQALRALGLDQVWLMVSPGNPLKPARGMAPLGERLASARRVGDGRRVIATDVERGLGTRYTVDTLARLRRRFPRARLVLVIGADNLVQLPRWRRWREVARDTAIAVLPRPGWTRRALAGQAARVLGRWRRSPHGLLAGGGPAGHAGWCLVPSREHAASASAIRAARSRGKESEEASIARTPKAQEGRTVRRAGGAEGARKAPATTMAAKPRAARKAPAAGEAVTPGPARGKAPAGVDALPRPARSRARRQKVEPSKLEALVDAARKSLEDDKAEDVVVLDVTGRADYADRLIIATGLVDRQLQAMATHLDEAFEKAGLKLSRNAVQASPDWVLIDAGDLVVHLFRPETRALYGLEKMWGPESPGAVSDESAA